MIYSSDHVSCISMVEFASYARLETKLEQAASHAKSIPETNPY